MHGQARPALIAHLDKGPERLHDAYLRGEVRIEERIIHELESVESVLDCFGCGKGVVAYPLLCNHISLNEY